MKYYKVEVIARDITKPDIEPEIICILSYRNLTALTNNQLEEKVKEDLEKIPDLLYNKISYSIEISEKEFNDLQLISKSNNIFKAHKSFS